jgi:exodeoxyribonuclease VII small subunit
MTTKKKETPPATFDEAMRRLQDIVEQLENGDVPLERAMDLYEQGISLSKICTEKLTAAELTLKRLGKDLNGKFTVMDEEE